MAWCPLQLYDAESNYLGAEYSVNGNVIKVRPALCLPAHALNADGLTGCCLDTFCLLQGFEGFLSSKDVIRKRQRTYKVHDRAFSLSSVTSPAVRDTWTSLMLCLSLCPWCL